MTEPDRDIQPESRPESGPNIRVNDRLFLVGQTGSGKSTLASYLFSRIRAQKVLVDSKGEWRIRGAVTVRTPEQLAAALERAPIVRYVPARDDRDEWEGVYETLFRRRRLFVWTDEATSMTTGNQRPRGYKLIQTQGRGLGIGHMICTQRPRDIARESITEAQHIFVFAPPLVLEDLDAIAREMALPRDELRARLAALAEHSFLWWDRRAGEIVTGPPLPAQLRRAAGAHARQL